MKLEVFSYRYGREILEHPNFEGAWTEIEDLVRNAPVFVYRNKSRKNPRLYVVQQLMNAYFDRAFAIEKQWEHHPLATAIEGSLLRADFRKIFQGRDGISLAVQAEVQFGNMARWYSDIFKFQAAYSAKRTQLGLSIIPLSSLARVTDSNVVNFERAKRELPSAELSITLPIVMLGIAEDQATRQIDVSRCRFASFRQIVGQGSGDNLRRIVHGYFTGKPMEEIGPDSDVGPPLVVEPEETEEESDSEAS